MISEFSEIGDIEVNTYGGIYIGGGNTFRLLYLLREHGMVKKISKFLCQ
ncbi:MAG: Type 1 glutamine amidotransferase-like domain-containing protein [Candidatus Peribacteria bacterium]|nr:Type 1 glutamine amidotransferase-like domain-containing protein [Candidatus Peribacteria bacterium]